MAGSDVEGPLPDDRGLGRWRARAVRAVFGLACAVAAAALAGTAAPQDRARLAAGEDAWDKAGCLQCHGSDGEGGSGGEFPPGPSLHKTRLDRAGLVETVSCGLPGTPMPAWLDGAYTERTCYGFTAPPDGTTVTPVLSTAEVEALVDYLLAKMVGK